MVKQNITGKYLFAQLLTGSDQIGLGICSLVSISTGLFLGGPKGQKLPSGHFGAFRPEALVENVLLLHSPLTKTNNISYTFSNKRLQSHRIVKKVI